MDYITCFHYLYKRSEAGALLVDSLPLHLKGFTDIFWSCQSSFEDAGRSGHCMLHICTRSHRRGISWSLTVWVNTQGLSFYPPPPPFVCWGESVRLQYLSWIELLLNFLYLLHVFVLCSTRPYFKLPCPWDLPRRGEERKTETTSDRGVTHGSGIRKTQLSDITVRIF